MIYWAPGEENLADYFTKHHSPAYHRKIRSRYLVQLHNLEKRKKTSNISIYGKGVLIPTLYATSSSSTESPKHPDVQTLNYKPIKDVTVTSLNQPHKEKLSNINVETIRYTVSSKGLYVHPDTPSTDNHEQGCMTNKPFQTVQPVLNCIK